MSKIPQVQTVAKIVKMPEIHRVQAVMKLVETPEIQTVHHCEKEVERPSAAEARRLEAKTEIRHVRRIRSYRIFFVAIFAQVAIFFKGEF